VQIGNLVKVLCDDNKLAVIVDMIMSRYGVRVMFHDGSEAYVMANALEEVN